MCLIEGHTHYLKNVLNMLLIADCWALVMTTLELLVAVGSPVDVIVNKGAVVVVLASSPVVDMT